MGNNFKSLNRKSSFSSCGSYRWWLSREIGSSNKNLLFKGLNPSKADDSYDDATLKRLMGFGKDWGYGRLTVVNLFARISPSPTFLCKCFDPIGDENDSQIFMQALEWSLNPSCDLWVGWGAKGVLMGRNLQCISMLRIHLINRLNRFPSALGPLALGLTSEGQPRHPLYAPKKLRLNLFELNEEPFE